MTLRGKLAVMLSALGLFAGLSAPPASAAGTVWIYVSLPTWLGNCPNGGSVRYLHVSTWSLSASDYKADYGDDLVWIKAGYKEDTTIVARGLCYKGSSSYWGANVSQTIWATRTGQCWWVGPAGKTHN